MPEQAGNATPEIDARRLELERTHIAYEQSIMTWIRTAIALITFGFTIYKFFQLELPGRAEKSRLLGPREFALVLSAWVSFHWCWRRWNIGAADESSSRNGPTLPARWHCGWPP